MTHGAMRLRRTRHRDKAASTVGNSLAATGMSPFEQSVVALACEKLEHLAATRTRGAWIFRDAR